MLGDGVNIASRLQALAEPDTICISQAVYKEVEKKLALGMVVPLGKPKLKNIAERFAVYALLPEPPKGFRQKLQVQRLKLRRRVRPVHWRSIVGLLLIAGTIHYLPFLRSLPFSLQPPEKDSASIQPKLKQPTFHEKEKDLTLSFGNNNASFTRSLLEKATRYPFRINNVRPGIYLKKDVLFVDVQLYHGVNLPPVELKHNEIIDKPLNWDMNSSEKALELVDENMIPMFQMFYKSSAHIVLYGIFQNPQEPHNIVFISQSGIGIDPIFPLTPPLKRIFKYPAWKYPGQYEEP